MFGMRMWGIYESKPLYGPLLVLGLGFWGLSIILDEHTIPEYITILILMGVAGLVYVKTGEKGLLLYFALMLGMKGIAAKDIFKVGILVGGAGMICLAFLSSFGLIEDVAYVQERSHVGEVFRRSLGFPHPNTLSTSFTILAMMIMYVVGHQDKVRVWKATIILFVMAAYIYLYSGSRTGIAITTGYLLLNLLYSYRNKLGIIEKIVIALVLPALWIISIVAPAVLSEEALQSMVEKDATLAARWTVGNYYMKYNSFKLFGQRLNNPKPEVDGIDLSQLYLLLQLGIVAFIIVSALWIILLYTDVKQQKISELVIIISLLAMGITDPFLYNIGFKNLAFVFMGVVLYDLLSRVEAKGIRPVAIGARTINLPEPTPDGSKPGKTALIAGAVALVIAVVAAIVVYRATPDPEFILADRQPGEHRINEGLVGHTYSGDEIKEFKAEGNMVLNYTDDQELMYTHYTDEADMVPDGYYAPQAGAMEKLRTSISIVFWGCSIIVAAIGLIPSLTDRQGKAKKQ